MSRGVLDQMKSAEDETVLKMESPVSYLHTIPGYNNFINTK